MVQMNSADAGAILVSRELWEPRPCSTREAPPCDLATWRLAIGGAVRHPRTLSYDELVALPRQGEVGGLRCRQGFTMDGLAWEGVAVRDLLATAEPLPEATAVIVHAGPHTETIALLDLLEQPALLAYRLNGQPLPLEHGAPFRLVVPHLRARFNVKWVDQLELVAASEAESTI
jgi:DMSO/TMAO reductase YedYZ molybdopterin-dependent catalytic subunit